MLLLSPLLDNWVLTNDWFIIAEDVIELKMGSGLNFEIWNWKSWNGKCYTFAKRHYYKYANDLVFVIFLGKEPTDILLFSCRRVKR